MCLSRSTALCTFGLLLLIPASLLATHPQRKEAATFDDFLKGDFQGVSLTSEGRLVLAPESKEVLSTDEAFIYTLAANKLGTLFLGTGNNGKIFRLEPDGSGKEWAKLEEAGVYALAIDSQNRLYAGAGPDAKIYRFDADGKAELFCDLQEKYIWSLLFDAADNLYAATGPAGKIYRVAPSGDESVFYDSEETHIVSLAWDLNRNLLAGTAPGGQLVRLDAKGKPFVLLDSTLEEVRSIAVDRYGVTYAAAISGGRDVSATKAAGSAGSSSSDETAESKVSIFGTGKGSQLEVYRIDQDGLIEKLYASDQVIVFDLALRPDGSLLLATGDKGKVYGLSPKGFLTILADTGEEQVTRLFESGSTLFVATSNLGKVYKLSPQASARGSYESAVIDAGMMARWGTIEWNVVDADSGGKVELYSRQGNSAKPDRTWTDWQGPYSVAAGSPIQGIASRYLQWKLEVSAPAGTGALLSPKNAVDRVSVAYLQANQSPRIESVTVHTSGVALSRFPQANTSGGVPPGGPDAAHAGSMPPLLRDLESPKNQAPQRKIYIPGARSISWEADDPNEDLLTFSLYYRQGPDEGWTLLKEGVEESEYTLDGASFPDGTYWVKVVASDERSNPVELARRHELISRPFVIGNALPTVEWKATVPASAGVGVAFTVSTSAVPLYQVEYAVDGGPWQVIFPEDGIVDQRRESFSLTLKGVKAGRHEIRVRAVDSNGNLATAGQSISAP